MKHNNKQIFPQTKSMNKGFTLIELLIGITVATMIFLLAGSIISLIFRTDVKGQRVENFEQAKNDIAAEISTTIRWAQQIQSTTGDLGSITADTTIYKVRDGRLFKNNEALTPNNIVITKFIVINLPTTKDPQNSLTILTIHIEMESKQTATSKDSLDLVVSQRQTILAQ